MSVVIKIRGFATKHNSVVYQMVMFSSPCVVVRIIAARSVDMYADTRQQCIQSAVIALCEMATECYV